jgi:putative ABC transport system substrate-binding protein
VKNLRRGRSQGLIIHPDSLFTQHRGKLAALAIREKLPALYSTRNFPEAGCSRRATKTIVSSLRSLKRLQTWVGPRTIPIVFAGVSDPVDYGIVPRLDRPSGNATGFALFEPSLGGKWLELLSKIAPGLMRAAIMFNPDINPFSPYVTSFETAVRSLKVEPIIAPVHSDAEIETAITALGHEPGSALVVIGDLFTALHRAPIISAAARNNVPAVYGNAAFVRDGGLLFYGADGPDIWRRAASYVDRILRGAKPGDLPVQFPTKFELVINLKTAKALGLTIPETLLATADEVIQ